MSWRGLAPEITNSGANLSVSKAEGLPRVLADKDRLGQVVRNLLVNAMQAGGDEPVVGINVGPGPDGGVQIQVRDRGPRHRARDTETGVQAVFHHQKGRNRPWPGRGPAHYQ